jgi:hypothetical protein
MQLLAWFESLIDIVNISNLIETHHIPDLGEATTSPPL